MNITESVTRKLKLFTSKKVVTQLDGNYDSLFKGKGIELDSLREYVAGDAIKDIDWRATARTNKTQTRKYTTLRDQRILIVADTSHSMLVEGYKGLHKRDALYAIVVILGAFVKKNSDIIALAARFKDGRIKQTKYNNTNNHIESILQELDKSIMQFSTEQLEFREILLFVLSATKRRTAVFVITDSFPEASSIDDVLKKISSKHQVFYVQLTPAWPFTDLNQDSGIVDIESNNVIDSTISLNKQLSNEWVQIYKDNLTALEKRCRQLGIAFGSVESEDQTIVVVQNMFIQARKYAQRKR